MTSPAHRSRALTELAEILAEGYFRLLAQRRAQFKDSDGTACSSSPSALSALDNSGHQRDVSETNTSVTGHTGRGCYA